MIIAANVGVLDEFELIEKNIDSLRICGFDEIVVTDMGSTDGTLELLKEYEARKLIHLLSLKEDDPDRFHFNQRMYDYTAEQINPDWVAFLDADEFFVFREGGIREFLQKNISGLVRAHRFNVPITSEHVYVPDDIAKWSKESDFYLITNPIRNFSSYLKANPDTPWILGQVMPKVIANTSEFSEVGVGGHSVIRLANKEYHTPNDIFLAHYPITSRKRFVNKLSKIQYTLENYGHFFKPGEAWHWKRWDHIYRNGMANDEYDRLVFGDKEFLTLVDRGIVTTSRDWFRMVA